MGTPRGVARKLANEGEDHGALLERERGVRERAAAADRRRDAHVHDLCCLEATMAAIRAAAVGLAPQWNSGADRDDLYATPPTVSEHERKREKERKAEADSPLPTLRPLLMVLLADWMAPNSRLLPCFLALNVVFFACHFSHRFRHSHPHILFSFLSHFCDSPTFFSLVFVRCANGTAGA